jgi:hypothetical protein
MGVVEPRVSQSLCSNLMRFFNVNLKIRMATNLLGVFTTPLKFPPRRRCISCARIIRWLVAGAGNKKVAYLEYSLDLRLVTWRCRWPTRGAAVVGGGRGGAS